MTYYVTYVIGDPEKFVLCRCRKKGDTLEQVFKSPEWTGFVYDHERTRRTKITKQRAREILFLGHL